MICTSSSNGISRSRSMRRSTLRSMSTEGLRYSDCDSRGGGGSSLYGITGPSVPAYARTRLPRGCATGRQARAVWRPRSADRRRAHAPPVRRSQSSTMPSAASRPTMTIVRHAEQLGVAELHAGRHLRAVVEEHVEAGSPRGRRERLGDLVDRPRRGRSRSRARRTARRSRGQMRPFSSLFASAMTAMMRVTPMPYEPIVTVTSLPFSSSTLSPSASAYLRPSWKTWPISMPRASSTGPEPSGAGSPATHLGRPRRCRRPRSRDRRRGRRRACPCSFAPVIQPVPSDDARVEEVADAGVDSRRAPRPRRPRADVALDEARVRAKSASVAASTSAGANATSARLRSTSRSPGRPTTTSSRVPSRCGEREHDVLERVGRGPRAAVGARVLAFASVDEGLDRRGVRGVEHLGGRQPVDRQRGSGATRRERLDVRGVAAGRAHEGVLADRGGVQELLALRAAHRAGVGLDDHVLEAEAREDALVGVALLLVARRRGRRRSSRSE